MKINKENFGWIFTCIFLFLLLGLSLYLGISGWFFKTEVSYITDMEMGKTVQVSLKKNQAETVALSMEGSFLCEERLPQIISVKNIDETSPIYLRAKINIVGGDNEMLKMGLVETINWLYSEDDGYYYFNELLPTQDKVALCSHIFIDGKTDLKTYSKYIVSVVVESLDSSQDVENIWGNNPVKNV